MDDCIDHGQRGTAKGYGKCRVQGKTHRLHRVVYAKARGVSLGSLEGLVIRHTCDNSRCINPDHLITGTHTDNVQDRVQRGRSATGEVNGQCKLTDAQVTEIRTRYVFRCPVNGGRALAKEYGVHQPQISRIINNKTRNK